MPLQMSISIDGRQIGDGHPTYIIAEMSANHNQCIVKARELIVAAKEAGADAIKLQTYRADTLTLKSKNPHFYMSEGLWQGEYLYDLYDRAHLPWEFHSELFELAKKLGITCFSSPFNSEAVDSLEELNTPSYKVASAEIIDLPLIQKISATKKPILMSTGGATLDEINEAVRVAKANGASEIGLLKCTSIYPAPPETIDLNTIPNMMQTFGCPIGYSDHTIGNAVSIASVAKGASIIEKHFMLDDQEPTPDSAFSATPSQLAALVRDIRTVELSMGRINYPETESIYRRCVYATKDIEVGEVFTERNIANLRPGGGELKPRDLDKVIGRCATQAIKLGEPICWDHIGSKY